MARPTKQGLDYFSLDVGFFGDKNVRILKARYRADGIAVYIKLLCDIYKEGYFLPVERWEDYMFVIADEFGITTNAVEQIITFLQSHAMIHVFKKKDELTGLDVDAVITSHGIQKRFAVAIKSRKKGVDEIKRGFWLLTDEEESEIKAFYKQTKNDSFSENNPDKSENNPDKSENNSVKESTVKESNKYDTIIPSNSFISNNSTYIGTNAFSTLRKDFFQRYPTLKYDEKVDDSHIDYKKLSACFARSKKHLQKWHSFAWVASNYTQILEGKYDDYAEASSSAGSSASPAKEKPLPKEIVDANARADRERYYAKKREKAQKRADKMLEKANQSPEFFQSARELSKIEFELAKAEVYNPQEVEEILRRQKACTYARDRALEALGLSLEDISPKWDCKKCEDKGFLPSGEACSCYKVNTKQGD